MNDNEAYLSDLTKYTRQHHCPLTEGAEPVPKAELPDLVDKAIHRAWQLGQTYWQQADSETVAHTRKASSTYDLFHKLVCETREILEASTKGMK